MVVLPPFRTIRCISQSTKTITPETTTSAGRFCSIPWLRIYELIFLLLFLFYLFSADLQSNYCLALVPIRLYFIYTEVIKLSEHCSKDNIRRWVWFIYWLLFWYLFASILFICFIYSNLLLHGRCYCITMFSSCLLNIYRGKIIIII